MKLYSWNVNGIRAVIKKGTFQAFVAEHQPDILGLQETKATQEQVYELFGGSDKLHLDGLQGATENRSEAYTTYVERESQVATPQAAKSKISASSFADGQDFAVHLSDYDEFWNSASKKGYSGTAIFTKIKPISVSYGVPAEIANDGDYTDTYGDPLQEGRITTAEFEQFYYVTVYTPNSKDDLTRLPLRHKLWDTGFLAYVKHLEQTKPVIFSGDLNVAHTENDLANPKPNIGKHGFTDEEREGFQNFIDAGFVDTFRIFTPTGNGHYTWWTHWANARARNIGWRIDYFLVSAALKNKVKNAQIHADVMGSDHCPVSIELDI